jgi:Tol biopolymer transport system component
LTQNNHTDSAPQFSPDGRKVLFYSTIYDPLNFVNPESYDLYTIELSGRVLSKLTPDSAYFHFSARDNSVSVLDAAPRISPDGTKIVFQNYRQGAFVISMLASDGSNCVNLVSQSGVDFAPFFFPDGQQLLFRSHRGADFDLYRMRPILGSPQIAVTSDNGHTIFGDFSDDGSKILYFSDIDEARTEYYHIYAAHADGSNRVKLTHGSFADYFPEFQPAQ